MHIFETLKCSGENLPNPSCQFWRGSYKPCTHPHPPTLTQTLPHPHTPSQKKITPTHTHLHPAKKKGTPTHTYQHPARKRSHSPTLTNTKPKKGHKRPQLPTPGQKNVTLTHTHPHPDKRSHPAKRRSYPPTHN